MWQRSLYYSAVSHSQLLSSVNSLLGEESLGKMENLKRQPKSTMEELKSSRGMSPPKSRRGEFRKTEAGTTLFKDTESTAPSFLIVDGRIVETPPNLREIRIKRCKKFNLPVMSFLPLVNDDIINSRSEIFQREFNKSNSNN